MLLLLRSVLCSFHVTCLRMCVSVSIAKTSLEGPLALGKGTRYIFAGSHDCRRYTRGSGTPCSSLSSQFCCCVYRNQPLRQDKRGWIRNKRQELMLGALRQESCRASKRQHDREQLKFGVRTYRSSLAGRSNFNIAMSWLMPIGLW